jgi:hypothetical protein
MMMRNAITRLTLAAVTAASLGFGATQALAAPAAAAGDAARACKPDSCDRYCRERLGGIRGECSNGQCLCLF